MSVLRTINNAGEPLQDPGGNPLEGVKVTFRLVAGNVPVDAFDAITGERIVSVDIVTTTNAAGEFSVNLWPCSRATTAVKYRCIVQAPGAQAFDAVLPEGDLLPIKLSVFKSAGQVVTPQELTAFQSHVANSAIHRHITVSVFDPSGGADGDIWIKLPL